MMWKPRQTLGNSLSDMKAHVLGDTIADTPPEVKVKTIKPNSTRCKCRDSAPMTLEPQVEVTTLAKI